MHETYVVVIQIFNLKYRAGRKLFVELSQIMWGIPNLVSNLTACVTTVKTIFEVSQTICKSSKNV